MSALAPTITDAGVTLTWGAAGQYYGYCTVADVEYEFPNAEEFALLTASTVAQEISYASQQMHELLENAYVMPYAGSDAGILLTLRDINAKLAAGLIIQRYFQADSPNASAAAAERHAAAMVRIHDVLRGAVRWDAPFGDAVSRAMKPVYDVAAGIQITPSPQATDGSATPIFTVGRVRFRRDSVM